MDARLETFKRVASEYFAAIGTPHSLTCEILLRNEEWGQLATQATNPANYLTAHSYHLDQLASSFLKKMNIGSDEALVSQAKENWLAIERKCARTNLRFQELYYMSLYPLGCDELHYQAPVLEFLQACRTRIRKLLGRAPSVVDGKFGPGATYSLKGSDANLFRKIAYTPECTASLVDSPLMKNSFQLSAWERFLGGNRLFDFVGPSMPADLPIVRGNRWATVPKDATKKRCIAIEPSLNMYLQLGIGAALRQRLRKEGLLLAGSQESQGIHRRYAQVASRDESLATVDLSDASDTICYWLVKYLLPSDWFRLLDDARSPVSEINGKTHHLEKFSSMGNGFTFELETAIFYTIAKEVVCVLGLEGPVSVFGDDIIIPTGAADTLLRLLPFFGFKPNHTKSFKEGPFRESCGGDFFDGHNVRGLYVKEIPSEPQDWMVLHNQIYRLGMFPSVCGLIKGLVPSTVRKCVGPAELGDICFTADNPPSRVTHSVRKYRCYIPVIRSLPLARLCDEAAVVALLYFAGTNIPVSDQGLPIKGNVSGYKVKWVAFS